MKPGVKMEHEWRVNRKEKEESVKNKTLKKKRVRIVFNILIY